MDLLRNCCLFVFCYALFINPQLYSALNFITIGAILENDIYYNETSRMLQYAVEEANDKILQDTDMKLGVEIRKISKGQEYTVSERVCYLLGLGIGALIGPKSESSSYHAMNIGDAKEIPYISTNINKDFAQKSAVLNMYPSEDSLLELVANLVNVSQWQSMTILYESPLWLNRVTKLLELTSVWDNRISLRNLDYMTNSEFRPTLQDLRDSNDTNIILECSIEPLPIILKQAMQVGLLTKNYKWIITNLDAHTVDLDPFQYSGTEIRTFRILNQNHPVFSPQTSDDDLEPIYDESDTKDDFYMKGCTVPTDQLVNLVPDYPEKFKDSITLSLSLIYDAVMVFATAIKQLGSDQVLPTSIRCDDSTSIWNKGYTILNYMKSVKYDGISGKIEFDNLGVRSNISIDILLLTENGLEAIGDWISFSGRPSGKLLLYPRSVKFTNELRDDFSLRNKSLRIITALAEPYTMLKSNVELLEGNDRFEGFAIDLIAELAEILEFEYTFIVEDDGKYGECRNNITNEWDGMIGKVMRGEADIAITDLTVTSERIRALDFTPSILNLGIAILYQVPRKAAPSTFSFMAPFGNDVWIILGITYILVSLCFFILGRISPSQWENPYPCIEEPAYLENQFTLNNAMWFAAGALLQQGSEIEVKAASIRLGAAVWWFFTLIMVSSYTANLAAFLVAENKVTILKDVEDFKECGLPHQPKCKAMFGAKHGGSTFKFFQDSKYPTFVNMYNVMINNPDLMVNENHEGLSRAQTENYAYLMESTSLLYYTERFCNVTMVGELIDDRNYAIGMRKGYKYYNTLSEGVLRLQERGVMDKLHMIWWKSKRGGGACQKEESTEAESLEMDHLEGVFVIVWYGSIFAFLYGAVDATRLIRKRAKAANLSFRDELRNELAIFWKSLLNPNKPKPVRSTNSIHSNGSIPSKA